MAIPAASSFRLWYRLQPRSSRNCSSRGNQRIESPGSFGRSLFDNGLVAGMPVIVIGRARQRADQCIQIGSPYAHTPSDSQSGQRARPDPVSDRLRVELQQLGDLGYRQELVNRVKGSCGPGPRRLQEYTAALQPASYRWAIIVSDEHPLRRTPYRAERFHDRS